MFESKLFTHLVLLLAIVGPAVSTVIVKDPEPAPLLPVVYVDKKPEGSDVDVHVPGVVDLTNENGKAGSTVDLSVLSNLVTVNTNKTHLAPGLTSSSTIVTVFGIPVYVGSALVPKKHVVIAERFEPPPPPPLVPLVHTHKSSSLRVRADSNSESNASAGSLSPSGSSATSSYSSGQSSTNNSVAATSAAAAATAATGASGIGASSSGSASSLLNHQKAEFEVERTERRKNTDLLIDLFKKFDAKLQQQSETIRELKHNQATMMSKIQKREQQLQQQQ